MCFFTMYRYVGRSPCASVATGNKASHIQEEVTLLTDTFKGL